MVCLGWDNLGNWVRGQFLAAVCIFCFLLSGCDDQTGSIPEVEANLEGVASQTFEPEPLAKDVAWIEFENDRYLKDICGIEPLPVNFTPFESEDFIAGSPLPVTVSGAHYEVRRFDDWPKTVYDQVEATIFKDVLIQVHSDTTAPDFSFQKWEAQFAVSYFPFGSSGQLVHRRAMGATFPFEHLSTNRREGPKKSHFAENFLSAVNVLSAALNREEGQQLQLHDIARNPAAQRATALPYPRRDAIFEKLVHALNEASLSGDIAVMGPRGEAMLLVAGEADRMIVAISTNRDAIGFQYCALSGS